MNGWPQAGALGWISGAAPLLFISWYRPEKPLSYLGMRDPYGDNLPPALPPQRHGAGLGARLPGEECERSTSVWCPNWHCEGREASCSAGPPQAGCLHPGPVEPAVSPSECPRVRCCGGGGLRHQRCTK